MKTDDEAIINAFFQFVRRERWSASLGDLQRRRKMLDRLNHCRDLDDRYARALPSNADVVSIMASRGAPKTCYVLSGFHEIDGQTLPLEEAVNAAASGGYGTILSCVPGKLAYHYDECGERRMLLERPPHRQPF